MEELGNTSPGKEEFLKLSEEAFDRFLSSHPPLVAENVPAVREQFLDMMETAYETDPRREVILEEEDIHCTHESGVRIHGFPDRVEKLEDGSCLIVDFKSGRQIVHEQDDIDSCLQVVIYAYLMESRGVSVSGGEYRYLRKGETVSCRYDEEMKKSLAERLELFRKCMQSGYFPTGPVSENGTDPCTYCKYGQVCGKADEEEAETGDGEEGGTE
jgi:CRISPR-associated protein Cas4